MNERGCRRFRSGVMLYGDVNERAWKKHISEIAFVGIIVKKRKKRCGSSWDFVKAPEAGCCRQSQRRGSRARGGARCRVKCQRRGAFLVNKFLNIFLRTRWTQFNGYCQSKRCGGRTLDEFPLEIQAAAK